MRNFSKKLAFVLAAAMVFTAFAPAAKAEAAEQMVMNRTSQTLYVNEGVNDKGSEYLADGLYGNVQEYDFYIKNKPADYAKTLKFAWASDNEKVATVDQKGLTKAVAVGTANITCTITEATGKEVAKATAKVTVKANAAEVVISNADDFDGLTQEVGATLDFNRTMVDAKGNETNKRGKYVTDLTKWVVDGDNADSVVIDQATGKYTFNEAGEYVVSCYTYQSAKYNQATAVSNKVVVIVGSDTFEVDQTASNGLDIYFENAQDLKIADVEVKRVVRVDGEEVSYFPSIVKGLVLSQDKKKASVTLFTNLVHDVDYDVFVKGFEEPVRMKAFVGAPVSMEVSSVSGPYVTIKTPTTLTYKLFDEEGNDVTNTVNGSVAFKPAVASTADYYVAGKTIYIYKEGVEVTVNAEYNSGKYENGKPVGNVPGVGYFLGVAATPITVADIAFAVKNGAGAAYANNEVPLGDGNNTAYLEVKIKTTQAGDSLNPYTNGATITKIGNNVKVRFRTSDSDILAVENNTIRLFQEGTAAIHVELITTANGQQSVTTVGAFYVTVIGKRATSTVELGSSGQVTVGTVVSEDTTDSADNFHIAYMNVTAKDQYGATVGITALKDLKFADGTPVTAGVTLDKGQSWQDRIKVDGLLLKNKIEAGANEAYLYMTGKVTAGNVDKDINFVVVVKNPTDDRYLSVEASGNTSGNVARYTSWQASTSSQKTAYFKVFEMSNGIKVSQKPVAAKPAEVASSAALGSLFYTVDRDGVDITGATTLAADGTVSIDFSKVENFSTSTTSGSAVIYRMPDWSATLGGGSYTYTLYKVVDDGQDGKTLAYEGAAAITVTCDPGAYSFVQRLSDTAQYTNNGAVVKYDKDAGFDAAGNQIVMRNCFLINNKNGENWNTSATYKVNGLVADDFVFVESIDFYENVGGRDYAKYTVYVNLALLLQ